MSSGRLPSRTGKISLLQNSLSKETVSIAMSLNSSFFAESLKSNIKPINYSCENKFSLTFFDELVREVVRVMAVRRVRRRYFSKY